MSHWKKKSENPKFTHSFTLETQLWTSQKNSSCPRGAHATDSAEISVIIILDAAGSYHRFLVRKFLVLEDLYDHPKDDFWQGREPGSVGASGKAFLGQVGRECQEPGGGCIQGTWHKAPKMWLWPKCVCPLMAKRRVAETGRDRLRKEGALNTMSERPSSALLCLEDRPP